MLSNVQRVEKWTTARDAKVRAKILAIIVPSLKWCLRSKIILHSRLNSRFWSIGKRNFIQLPARIGLNWKRQSHIRVSRPSFRKQLYFLNDGWKLNAVKTGKCNASIFRIFLFTSGSFSAFANWGSGEWYTATFVPDIGDILMPLISNDAKPRPFFKCEPFASLLVLKPVQLKILRIHVRPQLCARQYRTWGNN